MSRIYRAFVNGKEITNHYLNGKEISRVYGGGVLLWKKEQIREPLTMETYLPSSRNYHITNGSRFSCMVILPNSTEKWAFFNNKEPYTAIKSDVGDYYNIRIHAMAEIGGAICYLKSEKVSTTLMQITINSFIDQTELSNTYAYLNENNCGLVDVAWLMNDYIYCHFVTGSRDDGSFCHIVLKFSLNGELIEKYIKNISDKDEAYNYKFPMIESSYTTIKSGSLSYAVRLQSSVLSMYELNEDPFKTSAKDLLHSDTPVYYVGSCNNRHIFCNFTNEETIVYEFTEGEFIKKRVLPYNLYHARCCVCKNHIYGVDYALYDFGSIDIDSDRKIIFTVSDSIHYIQSQDSSIYVFHGESSEKNKQYMTIIQL